jgi:hypothetical protein
LRVSARALRAAGCWAEGKKAKHTGHWLLRICARALKAGGCCGLGFSFLFYLLLLFISGRALKAGGCWGLGFIVLFYLLLLLLLLFISAGRWRQLAVGV